MSGDAGHPIVLFDGVCNLCNASVRFIIERDPSARFKFAAQQSGAGQALLAEHGLALDEGVSDSIVLIEHGQMWRESAAALRIVSGLGGPWRVLGWLRVIPRPVRDMGYHFLARNRYRWFGKTEECRIPTPELRARFLAD
jgi:predicted DCC family thiol-disulfide oxidoreductase YuxK